MGVTTCPTDVVNAPVERVWALLENPTRFPEWSDLSEARPEPPGPSRPGQVIRLSGRKFGLTFRSTLTVLAVDPDRHRIEYRSSFPFGIVGHNRVVCAPIGASRCRVSLP